MALKKFRTKSKKAARKRIKITAGGDPFSGKLLVSRANARHYKIKKPRKQTIRAHKDTKLSYVHDKLRSVL